MENRINSLFKLLLVSCFGGKRYNTGIVRFMKGFDVTVTSCAIC